MGFKLSQETLENISENIGIPKNGLIKLSCTEIDKIIESKTGRDLFKCKEHNAIIASHRALCE